jgi:UDP-N-acetylmuramoylalanine--D-glutamate ligase
MDSQFKNKKVLVMGLGLNGGGVGVAKFFYKQGAKVLVTDLKTKEQLKDSLQKLKGLKIEYALGGHKEEDFKNADLIIKNPDVPNSSPYLEVARKHGVQIETDVTLFFKLSGAFIIGVTGTKGKSTTASLIFHLLKTKYHNVFLAGNIGVSPLEILPKIKKGDYVVLELSSFELENLKQSPDIAVITNVFPDHLNRYANMQEYVEAKKAIFKYQNKNDYLLLNKEDVGLKEFVKEIKAKVIYYSKENLNFEGFKLFGDHNKYNLAAAVEVARLVKVPENYIVKALKTFNRQEFVRTVDGVKYFNDTTATMPESAIVAMEAFSGSFPNAKLIFICGGQNKGLEFLEMADKIKKYVDILIMLPGTASDKIKESLQNYEFIDVFSMEEAVKKAKENAKRGDVVVLSPGAASFNLFKNEFDRGNQFVKFVKKLK